MRRSRHPAWAPIFAAITATVTDIGGVMSHAAIVCREYGLPAVVGTGRATAQIRTGQRIRVDGSGGHGHDPRRGGGCVTAATRRSLADLRAADAPRFGGKSASLGELLAAGIPVPPGFALSTAPSSLPARAASSAIGEAIAGMRPDDVGTCRRRRHDPRAVRDAVPEDVRAEIAPRYAELGEPPVAVRSSAVGEDSAEATFAGHAGDVPVGPRRRAVCDAVRDCWASPTSRARRLPRAAGDAAARRRWASRSSAWSTPRSRACMFTCNPVSGDPSTVAVNASWGLGLAVVGGEVTPDEYLRRR